MKKGFDMLSFFSFFKKMLLKGEKIPRCFKQIGMLEFEDKIFCINFLVCEN